MPFQFVRRGLTWFFCFLSIYVGAGAFAQVAKISPPSTVASAADPGSYGQDAKLALQSMQEWYDLPSGLYKTTGWWNSANLITSLADYSKLQHSHAFDFVLSNTLSAAQKKFPGFINEYYDDEGWWALAWIDAYEHTRDPRYLEAATFIFRDMTYGWDNTCSGGIWWSKNRKYKNAIANELFLSVAAELAADSKNPDQQQEYLTWAHKEWAWFSHSGMINEKHLVNDGLTTNCENNHQRIWTYNQGVILGGLTALSRVDHDSSLLVQANLIARATISNLTDTEGILHDGCEPHCGADGTQFKGVFNRNLGYLYGAGPQDASYSQFILTNARSIWSQAQPPDYHLGEVWSPPFGGVDASTQGSALDALVAAATTSRNRSSRKQN